jgi:hypothetical protein
MLRHHRTLAPPELVDTVDAHARAVAAGDDGRARSYVSERTADAHDAALSRLALIRPLNGYEVIARARLGHHYIVKVRFHGADGKNVTLQNRWHNENADGWRVVEVEDIGIRPPWVKPAQATVSTDG